MFPKNLFGIRVDNKFVNIPIGSLFPVKIHHFKLQTWFHVHLPIGISIYLFVRGDIMHQIFLF